MADSCATCFFFSTQPVQDTISGLNRTVPVCRRNAPGAPPVAASMQKALWPQVDGTDWCGDFLTVYPNAAGTWTDWVPGVTSSVGTLTSVTRYYARYAQVGKVVYIAAQIIITTNGTGAGVITVTLPLAIKQNGIALAGKNSASGKALVGYGGQSAASFFVTNYDGTYPGADGADLTMLGFYEVA
jgi:hypothetical protein